MCAFAPADLRPVRRRKPAAAAAEVLFAFFFCVLRVAFFALFSFVFRSCPLRLSVFVCVVCYSLSFIVDCC